MKLFEKQDDNGFQKKSKTRKILRRMKNKRERAASKRDPDHQSTYGRYCGWALSIAFFLLVGCASKPVVYKAPDSTKMDASTERLHKAVVAVHATHKEVQVEVAKAKEQVVEEGQHIEVLGPKLDDLFRIAPPELRDKIDAARQEVSAIKTDNAGLATRMGSIEAKQTVEASQILEATDADKQSQTDKAEYKAEAASLAQKASDESVRRANAENEVRQLKSQSLWRKIGEGLGIILLAGIALLWFTGKLTIGAASAAK